MKKVLSSLLAAVLLSSLVVSTANANAVGVFTVNSLTNGASNAVTTVQVDAGNTLNISAPGTWYIDSWVPYISQTTADGMAYEVNGFNLGALLGQIGSGPVFLVGSSFSQLMTTSGVLSLFINDSHISDNEGSIEVSVSAVPLPAALPLLLSGLGLVGFARRKQITAV